MKKKEVTLGGAQVSGYATSTPGLAVAKSTASGRWLVVHEASGRAVVGVRVRTQAERLAGVLAECGDWQRSAHDIVVHPRMRKLVARAIRTARAQFDVEETERALERARKREEKLSADADAA